MAATLKTTAKQRVLKKDREALCRWSSLYGEWQVLLKNGRLVGIGRSPAAAWKEAAEVLGKRR